MAELTSSGSGSAGSARYDVIALESSLSELSSGTDQHQRELRCAGRGLGGGRAREATHLEEAILAGQSFPRRFRCWLRAQASPSNGVVSSIATEASGTARTSRAGKQLTAARVVLDSS